MQTPTEKKSRVTELANMERARPAAATRVPAIVTALQPYLLTRVLAIGPALISVKSLSADGKCHLIQGDSDQYGWDEGDC